MTTPPPDEQLTPEQEALLALRQLRRRLKEYEQARTEPIAIVGMACRFPGRAADLEGYWQLLCSQENAVTAIPPERFPLDDIFDPNPQAPGRTYSRWAGLVPNVADFDAEFFGISPREAVSMDPQQRLLLETVWEALEHAGIAPKSIVETDTAVFTGITTSEYAQLYLRETDPAEIDAYFLQGSVLNAAPGRVSYLLGLHGPSLAIDTACSSSLVAVDRACRSLREGECQMAIAGGVNVLANRESFIAASRWGMLAPDGECKAFGAGADGFVRGEGCGVVVLKRLREAEQAGDRVLAVIRASVVNQDGASSGLTVPNGRAQQALLRSALAQAGVSASEVAYVEAHGTGTALGDPIEAEALGSVYGPVAVSSVKTQIGHLEAAAGMAGLLKAVLALQHEQWPGQRLGAAGPSAQIRWAQLGLRVVTGQENWPRTAGQRRMAGVSAFGFSGTNAHVLVEEAPVRTPQPDSTRPERPVHVLVLSARSVAALKELIERYQAMPAAENWADVCATSAQGRTPQSWRLAIVAATAAEAWAALAANQVSRGHVRPGVLAPAVILHIGPGTSPELADAARRVIPTTAPPSPSQPLAEDAITATRPLRLTAESTWADLARQLGELYCAGAVIDWAAWDSGYERQRVTVPGTVWTRQRYWVGASPQQPKEQPAEALAELLRRSPADWLYDIEWTPAPATAAPAKLTAYWLVVGSDALGSSLTEQGAFCTVVSPSSTTDFAALLRVLPPLTGIVLDAGSESDARAYQLALALLQAGISERRTPTRGYWFLTQATATRGHHSAVAALRRTLPLEFPEIECRVIDFDSPDRAPLLTELAQADPEVAYLGGLRLIPHLQPHHGPAGAAGTGQGGTTAIRLDPSAQYLVTGGLGALGLQAARWLVDRGARAIFLMGRTAHHPPELRELEANGARIRLLTVDCADRPSLARALLSVPRLRGVIHAAGVLDDHLLLDQTVESFARVVAPKATGARNLHELTRNLDFFVVYSSAAALLGSAGQANYCAANAMMTALIHERRAQKLPGTAIAWGPWAGAGMAAAATASSSGRRAENFERITPEVGAAFLDQALQTGVAELNVIPIRSWPEYLAQRADGGRQPLFSGWRAAASPASAAATVPFADLLAEQPANQQRAFLIQHLREQIAKILGHGPKAPRIDEDIALHDLGLDSLLAVELRNALSASLGRPLPATVALDYPTLGALADFLLPASAAATLPPPPPPLADLTDAEAEELLLAELDMRSEDTPHAAR